MNTQIYLISPAKINLNSFAKELDKVLSLNMVAVFQLRLKDCTDYVIIDAVKTLLPICHKYGIQFILNDNANLAKELGADGVHIGEDGSYTEARDILGKDKIIGVSCYDSIDRAMELGQLGADYVSFGAFYPTETKVPKANPDPEIIKKWSSISIVPCAAIGGINSSNAKTIIDNGADFIAVVSGVWSGKLSPEEEIKALYELCNVKKAK